MEEKNLSLNEQNNTKMSSTNSDISNIKKEDDIIEIARKRTEELDKANRDLEESLKKHDRLIAETIVRGKSFAGQKEKTFDDEINDEAERFAHALGRTFKRN